MVRKLTSGWLGPSPYFGRRSLNFVNRAAGRFDSIAAANFSDAPAPIIVVGLPRSGTTLAYQLIVQAFDVAYLTRVYSYTYGIPNITTRLMARLIGRPEARFASDYGRIPGRLAPAENAVLWMKWFSDHSELGHYFPSCAMSKTAAADAQTTIGSMSTIARRPFVFKNIYLTLTLPSLLKTLTTAKIIVVTRDIKAILSSVYKKRLELSSQSWWSIRPPFADDVAQHGIVAKTAFQCIRSKQILERDLALVDPDRCMVIDYREICRSPAEFVAKVAHWTEDDLDHRTDAVIPPQLEISQAADHPQNIADRFAAQSNALNSDRHQYLRRIDAYVAEYQPTNF